jgi:hypothetical protein
VRSFPRARSLSVLFFVNSACQLGSGPVLNKADLDALERLMQPCHNSRHDRYVVAWKFLAETTEPGGQIVRRYRYVAILHATP